MKKLALFSFIFIQGCMGFHYSDGERVGVVYKFSKKGYFFKTWEGQMMLNVSTSSQGGVMVPEEFYFSVEPSGPIQKIKDALQSNKKVKLIYSENIYFFETHGETNHFIVGVEEIK